MLRQQQIKRSKNFYRSLTIDKTAEKVLMKLRSDYRSYADTCLKIRAKSPIVVDGKKSKIIKFAFNKAQEYLHSRLEEQLHKFGYIRALILKGRQQGCSTYTEGRFFWRTSLNAGVKTFILAHEDKASSNLFRMAKRFYDHLPEAMRPSRSASNAKELVFDKLDSAYGIGTAGSGDVGRSDTIDFFHGSEVAFWNNTDEIRTGVLQAAESALEIILESTANGIGNMFHKMWQDAESGRGKYIAIFIPWYWQDEYSEVVPVGFTPTQEEEEYMSAYGIYDLGKIAWRRNKIVELGDPILFKQEYPATSAEAFQTTGQNAWISPELVLKSRKARNVAPYGQYIVGCDPAREGDDSTTFVRRQGRLAWGIERYNHLDDMAKAGRGKKILDSEPVDMMFIDRGGGSGMHDRLVELGYGKRVKLVNFGSKALDSDKYRNRRAEMYGEAKAWLESEMETQIPDDDVLQGDICAVGYKYTSSTQLQMEDKEEVKRRLGKSPDGADAFVLTFAEPVAPKPLDIPLVAGYGPRDMGIGL